MWLFFDRIHILIKCEIKLSRCLSSLLIDSFNLELIFKLFVNFELLVHIFDLKMISWMNIFIFWTKLLYIWTVLVDSFDIIIIQFFTILWKLILVETIILSVMILAYTHFHDILVKSLYLFSSHWIPDNK